MCLGLCGEAPYYELSATTPPGAPPPGAAPPSAFAAVAGPFASEEAQGGGGGGGGPLFRATVVLPPGSFPAERFQLAATAMPQVPFAGEALPSEERACDSAALLALCALHSMGLLARYWPTRLLLAQHLLPRGAEPQLLAQAAAQGLLLGAAQQQAAAAAAAAAAPSHFCPLCNVAATGAKAFEAHLRGFRHQRRIKQAQLLQQGEEVGEGAGGGGGGGGRMSSRARA